MGRFTVDAYEDGEEAYKAIMLNSYDLFIFDINTPSIDGLSLLEKLHDEKIYIPTIFISAITEIEQISKAYSLGCYDYLKKPFHLKKLTLHIDRLLKISDIQPNTMMQLSKIYTYDLVRKQLIFDGEDQAMTKKQVQIMDILTSYKGNIVDFDLLRHHVWYDRHIDNATIRAEVHRVRSVLKEDLIESIKGIGYRLSIS